MRTNEERTTEVKQRLKRIKYQHRQRENCMVAVLSVAVCLALVFTLSLAMPGIMERLTVVYGGEYETAASIFGSSEILGHIVVGLLSFILGAGVTVLHYHLRPMNAGSGSCEKDYSAKDN